jgi:hypothetical protein
MRKSRRPRTVLGGRQKSLYIVQCLPSRTTSWERPERKSPIHDRVLLLTPEWWSFRRRWWGTLSKAFENNPLRVNNSDVYNPLKAITVLLY